MYDRPSPGKTSSEEEESIRIADWIELNLLTNEEPSVSVAEITAIIAADPLDDSKAAEHRFDYPDDLDDLDPPNEHAGYWQQAEHAAELAFGELRQRSMWFGPSYPLTLRNGVASASSSFDSDTVASFLTLLRSRHLYHRALNDDGEVAGRLFEDLLPHALRHYLGTTADSSIRFGVSGGSRGGGLPLQVDEALDQLSLQMHEPRGELSKSQSRGDYAGDAVAWKALGDTHRGKLVVVGQATISERKWTEKLPSPKWQSGGLIKFLPRPTIVVAFVESISLTSKAWLDGQPATFSVLPLDRFRILWILRDHDIPDSLQKQMEEWTAEMLERLPR